MGQFIGRSGGCDKFIRDGYLNREAMQHAMEAGTKSMVNSMGMDMLRNQGDGIEDVATGKNSTLQSVGSENVEVCPLCG